MRRIGGIAKPGHCNKPVQDGDVFTPPEIAEAIAQHLKPHIPTDHTIEMLDACANDGVLGRAFMRQVPSYYQPDRHPGSSLEFQDIKISGKPLLDDKLGRDEYDIILCNPPLKTAVAEPIFHFLKGKLRPRGVMFFMINLPFFYQGVERCRNLGIQKLYCLPCYAFAAAGRPLLDVGIGVYQGQRMDPYAAMLPVFIDVPRLKRPQEKS